MSKNSKHFKIIVLYIFSAINGRKRLDEKQNTTYHFDKEIMKPESSISNIIDFDENNFNQTETTEINGIISDPLKDVG